MNDMFGTITQPFIRNTIKNNNTFVLELLMFYETRHKNANKSIQSFKLCKLYHR